MGEPSSPPAFLLPISPGIAPCPSSGEKHSPGATTAALSHTVTSAHLQAVHAVKQPWIEGAGFKLPGPKLKMI